MDHQRAEQEPWRGREVLRLVELVCNERRYFQEIIASLPAPLAVIGANGELLTSNRSFRDLFQLRTNDSGRKLKEILDAPELESAVVESAVRGGHANLNIQPPGQPEPLRVAVTPLRGWGNGSEGEALLTVSGAGAGLPAAQADSAAPPAVVWSMDPDSLRFTELSGDCETLFGYPREHWIGGRATAADRIHPSNREDLVKFYRRAALLEGAYSCEYRAVAATKKERWRRDSFRVIRNPDGLTRIAGITIDVTGRRSADEHAVLAHRADALVGLSRRLAHDLNNALMVISGYGEELLAHFPEQDPRRSDVQALMSAAETIAGIAGELMGFTRTQAGSTSQVDIGEIIASVSTRIRAQLGAVLVSRGAEDKLPALADPEQLEAILFSLARALRHESDPHMILTAARKRISDYTGSALAPRPGEYIEIVFRAPADSALEPRAFENLVAGRDPHGADLARAYAIIRDWGGWISAARTDYSAEVRILLPPAAAEPEPAAASLPPSQPPAPAVPPARTVLVVEDEPGIRALVRRILDREGYHVLDAANAAEADEVLRSSAGPIDLLITDVQLPGQPGPQLASRLMASMPQLRVIYMSGYTDEATLPAPLSEQGEAFLRKPFTRNALIKKAQEVLEAPRSEPAR